MRHTPALLFCVLAVSACAAVGGEGERPRLSVADAERAFAADAQARTVQEAFLSALSTDAITFRPTPVNAHQALSERPYPPTTMLRWAPTIAETAASGDFAVTTGPAAWGTRGQAPAGTGYFLSVWRAADRRWQVVFDAGIEAPVPATVEEMAGTISVRTLQPSPSRSDDLQQMRDDLLHVERELVADYPAMLREHAASDVRIYRNGHAPTATIAAALALVTGEEEVSWTPQAAFVASSGDLGYVYGVAERNTQVGYVRVWRNQDGRWKVAYDMK